MLAFVGIPGIQEILLIALVLILIFGSKKIPNIMKGIGSSVKEYKNVVKDIHTEIDEIKNV